jgi:hypothetical protein
LVVGHIKTTLVIWTKTTRLGLVGITNTCCGLAQGSNPRGVDFAHFIKFIIYWKVINRALRTRTPLPSRSKITSISLFRFLMDLLGYIGLWISPSLRTNHR